MVGYKEVCRARSWEGCMEGYKEGCKDLNMGQNREGCRVLNTDQYKAVYMDSECNS